MLVLTNLIFCLTPLGIIIGSIILKMDPYYHLLQYNLPIYVTDKLAYKFVSTLFRCVMVSWYSESFRYACIIITSLGLLWANCFTSMSILTSCDNSNCVGDLIDYHCKIVICYAVTHKPVENLLSFGISVVFWLLVCNLSLVFLLFNILPKFFVFWFLVCGLLCGYCFLCGLEFVALSNLVSKRALETCYIQAGKMSGNAQFERKIERKRAKSCRPFKIPFKPLGPIDKAFIVDFVNTVKNRVIDTILLKD